MKDRIMNTCLPLSYKYEYLKSYNDILITFKYSSFAMEESLRALEKSLSLDILKFNVYLNGIHNYLKRYGNFYNLEGEYYNWLKENSSILMFMNDFRAYDIVSELLKEKKFVYKVDDKFILRLKELFMFLNKYHKLPKQDDKFKFKDGSYMGKFISHNKKKIIFLKESNIYAYDIALYFEKMDLSFDDKLKETYEFLYFHHYLPSISSNKVLFTNGEVMGLWLGNNRNRLKNMNDFMSMEIIKCLDKRKLSFYDKLDELYDKFVLDKDILFSNCSLRDGTLIKSFIRENKKRLSQISNDKAFQIIKALNGLSFEEKVKETYDYLIKNNSLPFKDSRVFFSDGTLMGVFLYDYFDKFSSDDIYTKSIVCYLNKRRKRKLSFEEKIDEVYDYLIKNKCLPTNNKALFTNGEVIYYFISRNKDKLNLENFKEKTIYEYLESKKKLNFSEKIIELYDLLNESVLTNDSTFSDGVSVKGFLKDNKDRIYELKDNEIVSFIIQNAFKLSFDEKVIEAYNYIDINGIIPFQSNMDALFSDGTFIGYWLSNHKREIFLLTSVDGLILKEKLLEINPQYFDFKVKKL